jgi:hypothetical protein
MAESSNKNAPPHVVNGLLVRRWHIAPDLQVYLRNIVRMIVLNQAAFLTEQEYLSGLEEGTLIPIPETQFTISDAVDYNQQHCQVIGAITTDYPSLPRVDLIRAQLSFPVKSKTSVLLISYKLANAFVAAYQAIIETYFLARPTEFVHGFPIPIAPSGLSIQTGPTSQDREQRQVSSVPFIDISFQVKPQTQFDRNLVVIP